MKLSIQVASVSQTINVFIQDSSSTTGAGLTGLVFNTASLVAYYALPRAAAVQITLATLAAVTSAYSSGGFKEIDATNMPGWYRLDLPDAALASGRFVSIHLKGATNMAPLPIEIELTGWNNQDAVRGGLTALPNAAAEAAGGLYTRGTGAGQIRQDSNGRIDANTKAWIDGTIPAVNVTGVPKVDVVDHLGSVPDALSSGKYPVDVKLWLTSAPNALQSGRVDSYLGAVATGVIVAGSFAANALDAVWSTATRALTDKAGFSLSAAGVQAIWDALTSALTTAGSVGKRIADFLTGDAYVRLGAPAGASHAADVAAVKVDTAAVKVQTDKLTFTVANQIDANVLDWKSATAPAMTGDAYARLGAPAGASIAADLAEIEAETDDIAAVKAKTDNLPAVPAAAGDAMALTSGERTTLTAVIWAALTSGLTTAGSIGKLLVDNINATISSRLPTSSYTAPPSAAAVSDAVWDETIADHLGAGSTGASLNAAGSAGDPWATALPGAYGAGTAGKIVGDNVDAAISSRASQSSLNTVAGYVDTEVAAILAAVDTEVAAIKAKTDNLPATPAAAGDAMALTSGERNSVADALLDRANAVETGLTVRQSLRLALAALAGKLSGGGTTTITIRNSVADSKDRIVATVDTNGNRTAITTDVS